ncbi:hypothetical protein DID96_35200 [Burkholderia sp. Bp8963]|nr:hypothetical protein DID96_35200 [Burkholderia sp. Bp8963]
MPIYRTSSVEDEPTIYLAHWSVRKTGDGTLHLVGVNLVTQDGRVSTSVKQFDTERRVALTASGRRYELIGAGGYDADAEYVWNWAIRAWRIAVWTDVTAELVPDWRHGLPAL